MNGGRAAAVPHKNPSALIAARSAGRLARKNRKDCVRRSRPSVVTMTGASCCVTRLREISGGRPGQVPNARSGRSTAWNPLPTKRCASGCVSANARADASSFHIAKSTARRKPGGLKFASAAAGATSSHRSPDTSPGAGRWRSACIRDQRPRSATSMVAIIVPSPTRDLRLNSHLQAGEVVRKVLRAVAMSRLHEAQEDLHRTRHPKDPERLRHLRALRYRTETHAPLGRIPVEPTEHRVPHHLVGCVNDVDLIQSCPAHQAATVAPTETRTWRRSRRVTHPFAMSALPAPFADTGHIRDDVPDRRRGRLDDDPRLAFPP